MVRAVDEHESVDPESSRDRWASIVIFRWLLAAFRGGKRRTKTFLHAMDRIRVQRIVPLRTIVQYRTNASELTSGSAVPTITGGTHHNSDKAKFDEHTLFVIPGWTTS